MERFQVCREDAAKHLRIADHMLTITYPMVKDPKLLLTILDNLYRSVMSSVESLLQYERLFKRINVFGDSDEERLSIFKHVAQKYRLDQKYIRTIFELKELIRAHRNSPMEFARKDKFVIYTKDHDLKTISQGTIKSYITTARQMAKEIASLTGKDERLFR